MLYLFGNKNQDEGSRKKRVLDMANEIDKMSDERQRNLGYTWWYGYKNKKRYHKKWSSSYSKSWSSDTKWSDSNDKKWWGKKKKNKWWWGTDDWASKKWRMPKWYTLGGW